MNSTTQLLGLSMTPVRKFLRRLILNIQIEREYKNLQHFKWQYRNGLAGQKDSEYRIAHMESELRSLK